ISTNVLSIVEEERLATTSSSKEKVLNVKELDNTLIKAIIKASASIKNNYSKSSLDKDKKFSRELGVGYLAIGKYFILNVKGYYKGKEDIVKVKVYKILLSSINLVKEESSRANLRGSRYKKRKEYNNSSREPRGRGYIELYSRREKEDIKERYIY
ncbi:uncharacterized protein LY79DRAFT_585557, partial [Colletotrichum navitas]